MSWNSNLWNAYLFVSSQSNSIVIHYCPIGSWGWKVNTGLIKLPVKKEKKRKITPSPTPGFNSVQFHELTLIDSGLPLSSWRQSITSAACVECNTATS